MDGPAASQTSDTEKNNACQKKTDIDVSDLLNHSGLEIFKQMQDLSHKKHDPFCFTSKHFTTYFGSRSLLSKNQVFG